MTPKTRLLTALAVVVALPALAAGPALISYQARLEDAGGNPITAPTKLRIRLLQGGDASSLPSAGSLVYHELVTVVPTAEGVVSHLIGSGAPQFGCLESPCQLLPGDFPDAATPLWIEVTIDPDGVPGNSDDDPLLPRTRVVSSGYAIHATTVGGLQASELDDSLDSAYDFGGAGGGRTIVADAGPVTIAGLGGLAVEGQITLGNGTDSNFDIVIDRQSADVTLGWDDGANWFELRGSDLAFDENRGLRWPTEELGVFNANAVVTTSSSVFNGRRDYTLCSGFNINSCGGSRIDVGFYAMKEQWEYTYYPTASGPYWIEKNWDYINAAGELFRPMAFVLDTATEQAHWLFRTRPDSNREILQLRHVGSNGIGDNRVAVNIDPATEGSSRATLHVFSRFDGGSISSGKGITGSLVVAPGLPGVDRSSQQFFGLELDTRFAPIEAGARIGPLAGADVHVALEGNGSSGQSAGTVRGGYFEIGAHDVTTANWEGLAVKLDVTGSAFTAGTLWGMRVRGLGTLGAGSSTGDVVGLGIDDLRFDQWTGDALRIAPQTGGGAHGNLRLEGGGHDDGHLRLGDQHVWSDGSRLRVKTGAPGSATDGGAIVTGTNDNQYGPALWTVGANDCTTVCGNAGLVCVDAARLDGSGTSSSDCADTTSPRICFCK